MVVQDLFLTETAKLADVVLPVQAYTEREGTYTSGERRVQRFYPAVPPAGLARAPILPSPPSLASAWACQLEGRVACAGHAKIAAARAGLRRADLPEAGRKPAEQWPHVGRSDLYYGGTTYDNHQGLGVAAAAWSSRASRLEPLPPQKNRLCLRSMAACWWCRSPTCTTAAPLLAPSTVLQMRLVSWGGWLHPATAAAWALSRAPGCRPI